MRIILPFLFSIVSLITASAQSGSIKGVIKDQSGKGMPAATVSLLKAKDSGLVKVAVSDKEGVYEFINIKEGKYFITATSVGFAKAKSNAIDVTADKISEIPAIELETSTTKLTGVTVQTTRPFIENRIDKMVVNIDASPTNAGSTAMEVLEKSPGVSVDRDGNISLKGKQGIIVLMDGKQTYLSGQDLANLLRNMPASQLDQIEIMTQPSAKYDASGNSGIINLRTRKNTQMGFNGSISLSYVQGRYPKSPNSFSFNYRKGKVNFFTNLSYAYWSGFNDQHLLRRFRENGIIKSVFDQQADQKNSGHNYSGRFGLDYTIDKKTTIGFMINGIYNPRLWQNNGRADILNGNGQLDSFNIAETINRDTWKNFGTAVSFRRLLNAPGRELTADVDMIRYNTNSKQTSDNFNYFPNGTLIRDPFMLRGNLPSVISIYSGKVDYVHPLKKDAKIEVGVKSSYVSTDNDAQYTSYSNTQNKWVTDYGRSNHFIYKENINAAYINYSRQIKKWGFQSGLRMENTISEGNQFGNPTQKDTTF